MRELNGHMDIAPRNGGDSEKLEYLWLGPPPDEAPTLVFLHEGLGSVKTWQDFPAILTQATGLGTLVYSRKGYGSSVHIELPRQLDYMHLEAEEILGAVLDHWNIKSCILVGHSDGASIATIYTSQFNDPRVKGLVLMAPHFFIEEVALNALKVAKEAWETTDFREKLKRYHGDNVDCAFWGWNRVWLENDSRDWNIEEFLPKLKAPVLIIQGIDDPYGTPKQWEVAEEKCLVPVTVAALPDCQHLPFKENPKMTLEACVKFIADLV